MSMKEYPLSAPIAFLIDEEVAAYILLKVTQEDGTTPDAISELLKTPGAFQAAAKNLSSLLNKNDYFDIRDAEEAIEEDVNVVYASAFDGTADASLDLKDWPHSWDRSFSDDYIVFMEPMKSPSYFSTAYENIEAIIQEFRERLEPYGNFPEDFDWSSKLCSISGTYYC